MRLIPVLLSAALISGPALADDDALLQFGGDTYQAGTSVTVTGDTRSVFAAGESVSLSADMSGSAHVAGRNVSVDGTVAGSVYGAGMDVELRAPVAGDASLFGYDVTVLDEIAGNLRATGSKVKLYAPVAGSALIAGETVEIATQISGDLAISAENISWGEGAKVLGKVDVYTDEADSTDVPSDVAAPENVTFHDVSKWHDDHGTIRDTYKGDKIRKPSFGAKLRDFVGGVIFVGIVAFLLAVLAPNWVATQRARALENPIKALVAGFIGLSALVGSVVGFALTGIGIILAPFALVAAVFIGGLGYVLGAYALGVWLTVKAGRAEPTDTGDRAIAAFGGAAALALIGLVPFLGWWVALAIAWIGAGAMFPNWAIPRFFTEN